jgi:uncharacterized protein YjbI with pentapeptide repeats
VANPDHLALISSGVGPWNAWRVSNPGVLVDLSGAVLHETRTPWSHKELTAIGLEGVDLRGANLERVVLKGANLRGANFSSAALRYANLRRADLAGADLRGAKLNAVNFTLATLKGADLTDALFWETVLARTDLSDVVGLASARHGGPSVVDHRTLRRSGRLPREFLRGLGLSDGLIDHFSRKHVRPTYSDCFISHSSRDQRFADRLSADLQAAGVLCWYASQNMQIGARVWPSIEDAIRSNDRLIVVLSRWSLESAWVEKEVETALALERTRPTTVLLPVRIDDAVTTSRKAWAADIRDNRNTADFDGWDDGSGKYAGALARLLAALVVESWSWRCGVGRAITGRTAPDTFQAGRSSRAPRPPTPRRASRSRRGSRLPSDGGPGRRRNPPTGRPHGVRHRVGSRRGRQAFDRPFFDGPLTTCPSGAKREPWQGQSHVFSAEFHSTMPPR